MGIRSQRRRDFKSWLRKIDTYVAVEEKIRQDSSHISSPTWPASSSSSLLGPLLCMSAVWVSVKHGLLPKSHDSSLLTSSISSRA